MKSDASDNVTINRDNWKVMVCKLKCTGSSDWAILQPTDFEFRSRDTPQYNSLAELAFPYLSRKACAIMGGAIVPHDLQSKVALEAISCRTQHDGLVMVEVGGKTSAHVWCKSFLRLEISCLGRSRSCHRRKELQDQ